MPPSTRRPLSTFEHHLATPSLQNHPGAQISCSLRRKFELSSLSDSALVGSCTQGATTNFLKPVAIFRPRRGPLPRRWLWHDLLLPI